MHLTSPGTETVAQWDADWATRPGYLPPEQRDGLAGRQVCAIADGATTVGVIALALNGTDSAPEGLLLDLWISPPHRGLGYARAAVRLAEQWCAEHGGERLRVTLHRRASGEPPQPSTLFGDFAVTGRHLILPVTEAPALPDGVSAAPLARSEFDTWIARVTDGFVAQSATSRHTGAAAARHRATQMLARLLPDGPDTPRHEWWTVRHDDEPVAHLWVHDNAEHDEIFVYNVETLDRHRGRGYGRAAMRIAEERAVALGRRRVRLNVFAGNVAANALYESLGYRTVTEFRVKRIG